MQPFTTLTGIAVPLDRSNVDTDAIIPKQFLKRIERTGFGAFLFYDWRFSADGKEPGKGSGNGLSGCRRGEVGGIDRILLYSYPDRPCRARRSPDER